MEDESCAEDESCTADDAPKQKYIHRKYLPNHFMDSEIEIAFDNIYKNNISEGLHQYNLTYGLVLKLRNSTKRMIKRLIMAVPTGLDEDTYGHRLLNLLKYYAKDSNEQLYHLDPEIIWQIGDDVSSKNSVLSPKLQSLLFHHEVIILENKPIFSDEFIEKVRNYFLHVKRPEGTFDWKFDDYPLIPVLLKTARDNCSECNSMRHVYCGPCGRLLNSIEPLIGKKLTLPFDLLVIIHWHDSLVKCTATHTKVLCNNNVTFAHWEKKNYGESWEPVIASLNADTDIVLFPSSDAVPATEFQWNVEGNSSDKKWRVVVLEASWQNGKTMARQIKEHRESLGLPPLIYISLSNIVGQYWRFHNEGNSAVSTIEAITHCAKIAGLSDEDCTSLLLLFNLQKYRVQMRFNAEGKVPRAIHVNRFWDVEV